MRRAKRDAKLIAAALIMTSFAMTSFVSGFASAARAQDSKSVGRTPDRAPEPVREWGFPVGESAEYAVTFGPIKVGDGRLAVEAIDTVAERPTYRVSFELQGGPFFYKIDDRQVSWIAPDPIRSLRFEQHLRQGDYRRDRRYALDQRSGTYQRLDLDPESGAWEPNPEESSVPMPEFALDEIAYLYFVRTLPLEIGETYTFQRYFEEEGNPAQLKVLRRETVRVPAGRFETIVVQPIIHSGGLFSEGGEAEVYLTADERRIVVLLKTKMKAGEVNLYLEEYDPGRPGALIDSSSVAGAATERAAGSGATERAAGSGATSSGR